MAAHGLSAREAMGWVRVVRPGSVVGAQQHLLCRLGDALQLYGCTPCTASTDCLRDAVLSLEPRAEDRDSNQASPGDCGRSARRRCASVSRGRRPRVRPQSESEIAPADA